ncbi:MAG: VWA domain-containing protein [Myxococcales bacterium]|nr:VWA domain-containing protein [Myxococcales bacterium]
MSWGGLFAPMTMLWLALGAVALAGAAYLIRTRHRRVEVPFAALWEQVLAEKDASALWRRLRRLLSLLLIIAMLLLLMFAALDPILGLSNKGRRHVVIVLDASASMTATDGGEAGAGATRFDAAKALVAKTVAGLGADDQLLIIRADSQATPLSRFSSDKARVLAPLADAKPAQTPADMRRALATAANALAGRSNPMLIVISDGALPEAMMPAVRWTAATAAATTPDAKAGELTQVDLTGIEAHYLSVGRDVANVGIIAFGARRYVANKEAYEVYLEVVNTGDAAAKRKLVIANGSTPVDTREIEIGAGATLRQIYRDIPSSDDHRLTATLLPLAADDLADSFALDDAAFALLPPRKRQTIVIVSRRNEFLEGAISAYSNIDAEVISPEAYESAPDVIATYDAVVFNDYTPQTPPATHALYFAPDPARSPVPVAGELAAPRITDVATDHPVTKWVTLSDTNFDKAKTFAPRRDRGEVTLASSLGAPVIVASAHGGFRQVLCGFSLGGTDLVMRVSFPVLLINALDWFAGDNIDMMTTLVTGTKAQLPLGSAIGFAETAITTPSGTSTRAPVIDGILTYYPQEVGFYGATGTDGGDVDFSANLASPSESRIAPQTTWTLGGKQLTPPPAMVVSVSRRIWLYLVIIALALLAVEWFTYHRRVTV